MVHSEIFNVKMAGSTTDDDQVENDSLLHSSTTTSSSPASPRENYSNAGSVTTLPRFMQTQATSANSDISYYKLFHTHQDDGTIVSLDTITHASLPLCIGCMRLYASATMVGPCTNCNKPMKTVSTLVKESQLDNFTLMLAQADKEANNNKQQLQQSSGTLTNALATSDGEPPPKRLRIRTKPKIVTGDIVWDDENTPAQQLPMEQRLYVWDGVFDE